MEAAGSPSGFSGISPPPRSSEEGRVWPEVVLGLAANPREPTFWPLKAKRRGRRVQARSISIDKSILVLILELL